MYRTTSAAALSGILALWSGHAVSAAEPAEPAAQATGAVQPAPQALTPEPSAASAPAPAQSAAPAAGAPAQRAPAPQAQARTPGGGAAPAGAGKPPCEQGVPPWAGGWPAGPYGYGGYGPGWAYGGPWSRRFPPRPPFREWAQSSEEERVTVETDADKDNYYVIVHLAGLDPDKVQVQMRGRGIVVSSGLGWERRVTGPGAWETETAQQYFREFLTLPWDADVSKMSRQVEDGTLRIVIPRRGAS